MIFAAAPCNHPRRLYRVFYATVCDVVWFRAQLNKRACKDSGGALRPPAHDDAHVCCCSPCILAVVWILRSYVTYHTVRFCVVYRFVLFWFSVVDILYCFDFVLFTVFCCLPFCVVFILCCLTFSVLILCCSPFCVVLYFVLFNILCSLDFVLFLRYNTP